MRTSNVAPARFAALLASTVLAGIAGTAAAQTPDPNAPAPPAYGYPYTAPSYQPGQYPSPTYAPQPPPVYNPPPAWATPPPPSQPPPTWTRPSKNPYARRHIRAYLGVGGLGTFVLKQDGGAEGLDHGGGFSLYGGVDFGRILGAEISYTGSYHNPDRGCVADYVDYGGWCDINYLTLDLVTLSARLRIPLNSRVQPYFQGGLAIAWSGRQGYQADATGFGFELGGGLDIWLNNWFSVGPRVLYRGVRMSDYGTYTGGDTFLNLLSAEANLALHF